MSLAPTSVADTLAAEFAIAKTMADAAEALPDTPDDAVEQLCIEATRRRAREHRDYLDRQMTRGLLAEIL